MAAIARPGVCENRNRQMNKKLSTPAPSVASGKVRAPVRVKLRRKNCEQAIPYPPDGQARDWWYRLKNALGTSSSAFVEASMYQLIAAARLPNSGICEIAVNASLAFVEGAKPRDEIECALVIQMACTHSAAMAVLSRLGGAHGGDRGVAAMASAAARLLRPTQLRSNHYGASGTGALKSSGSTAFSGAFPFLPRVKQRGQR